MLRVTLISLILIIGFAGGVLLRADSYRMYVEEESILKIQLEAEEELSRELERERGRQGSDAFIEKIARDKFGYVYPDEIVFYNLAD